MKKILMVILAFLLNACASMQIKHNNLKMNLDYEYLSGVYVTSNDYNFKSDSSIMIIFNEETPEKIKRIEETYNLQLQEVLVNGYYIYKIDTNTIDKIDSLIDEKNIKSVVPKWWKNFKRK